MEDKKDLKINEARYLTSYDSDKKKAAKLVDKKDNTIIPGTEYAPNSDYIYEWRKSALGILICFFAILSLVFAPLVFRPANMEHGFIGANQKPGAVYNPETQSFDYSSAVRKIMINPNTITAEDDIKELAYNLYQIGNIGMMVSPQSGYYSEGASDASTMGQILPLLFQLTDIRNNVTGEAYRLKYQSLREMSDDEDAGLLIQLFAGVGGVVNAERRYYKAGYDTEPLVNFEKVKSKNFDAVYDWNNKFDNKELKERQTRSENPIPYTSAAVLNGDASLLGKKYGVFEMEYRYLKDFAPLANITVGGLNYADIFGDVGNTLIPVYKDCVDFREEGAIVPGYSMGREISYEKTDQHIFFSKDASMSVYNNIKSAEVKYTEESESGANDGYYTVKIELDCSVNSETDNNYTSADTCWALRDSQAAGTNLANFTKIEITFELWDNGYFKIWDMVEDWYVANAYNDTIGSIGEMGAEQEYHEIFTYHELDCKLTGNEERDYWSKQ
ncbi:MAG: hypothetical protein J5656_05255 [Clostridia bacterium]|nr:hypothetical protein [Clostridia bacterium]